ncbi:MAG: hypothetical protein U5M51_15790 [Emticicia sp.]|nr:hypothetical protein [Emticicia sp.]
MKIETKHSSTGSVCFVNVVTDDSDYEKEIKAWHQKRIEGLKKENGWLIWGFVWLEEGRNSFGGNTENKIIFPKDRRSFG